MQDKTTLMQNLKKSKVNRFYAVDDETLLILQKNNVKDFLDWSNMLVKLEERELICKYLSRYISDIKKVTR